MKIVLAFDSFKGSLSAAAICRIAAAAIREQWPDADVVAVPMADGGEGTIEALVAARDGHVVSVPDVSGPLPGQRLASAYGWLPDEKTAVVEMARASGLPLVPEHQRNPLVTTTRGTGELIAAALARGARRLLLTLGGSATHDGGTGAAAALGWTFLDGAGNPVPDGGGNLHKIARIVPPATRLRIPVEVLCDVDNPMCGRQGAAAIYGPQKGATAAMVEALDLGLRNVAEQVHGTLGLDVLSLPGGGAAGGFGAGAVAFLGGMLVPGAAAIARAAHLPEALHGADWVMTGEGCLDEQSLRGKVVSEVLHQARQHHVRAAVLAGKVELSEVAWRGAGAAAAEACAAAGMSTSHAMARADELAASACIRLLRRMQRPA